MKKYKHYLNLKRIKENIPKKTNVSRNKKKKFFKILNNNIGKPYSKICNKKFKVLHNPNISEINIYHNYIKQKNKTGIIKSSKYFINKFQVKNFKNVSNITNIDEKKYEQIYKEKTKTLNKLQKILIRKYILIRFQEKIKNIFECPQNIKDIILYIIESINFNNGISNSKVNNLEPYNIVKKIMAPEILEQINNNKNYNSFHKDKVNNLSIMNGGDFMDNNFKKNNTDKNKDKIQEIFNYLKDLKIFQDELLSNK